MPKKPIEIERIILAAGWVFDSQNGSHRQYKHPDKPEGYSEGHRKFHFKAGGAKIALTCLYKSGGDDDVINVSGVFF